MKSLALASQFLQGQPMFKLLAKANEIEKKGRRLIHFEIGDPNFDSFPSVVEAAVDALRQGNTHYTVSMGLPELREAICNAAEKDLGFHPSLEQVLIIPANAIIYFLIRCVVNPDEEVIIPDPGFATYQSAIDFIGAKPIGVPLREENDFRMNPADIRNRITSRTRLIIINSPQNPTGSVMTRKEIEEVAALAEEKDIYLLSDEVYRNMIYNKMPSWSPSLKDQCKERTVILNSFSKTHAMSGWRLGYAMGPEKVIEKMDLLLQTIISCVPPFIQSAGISALSEDNESIFLSRMDELRKRRDALVQGLNSLSGISCVNPDGAFYVFPNITKTGLKSKEFSSYILEKAGVVLLPGSNFGEFGEGYVRLSYASATLEMIQESIDLMRTALDEIFCGDQVK